MNSVGVDRTVEESGVAKMSLYRNFGSKSALVEAYLVHRDRYWQTVFQSHVLSLDLDPVDKVLVYCDLMRQWLSRCGFLSGCCLLMELGTK